MPSSNILPIVLLLLAGCAQRAPAPGPIDAPPAAVAIPALPAWIVDPGTGGVLGAVGTSRNSMASDQEQGARALADGREALTRLIQARVTTAILRVLRPATGAADQALIERVDGHADQIARQLTNTIIACSRQKARWTDPATGDRHAWVVIDPARLPEARDAISRAARRQLAADPAITLADLASLEEAIAASCTR
jgi:hypothetical protein